MAIGTTHRIFASEGDFPVLRLFHSLVEPFRRNWEEHRHTAMEISRICAGSGVYRVPGRTYRFGPGDMFLFGGNEPHCIVEVYDGAPLDILNLQFEPRFLWSPDNALYRIQYPDVFLRRSEAFSHLLSAPDTLGRQLLDIEGEFLARAVDYRLMVRLQVLRLLISIRREFEPCFTSAAAHGSTAHLGQLERAMLYIDHNLTEDISLQTVAREAAISRAYFCTLFKQWNGMTPWEYIQTRRVELAADKLAATDKKVLEIASECGYNSLSNFNRSFKAIIGKTPGEYRRETRAQAE